MSARELIEREQLKDNLLYVAWAVFALPLGAAWSGYVLMQLWDWFVVKPFGVPTLSLAAAAGLGLLVRWLTQGSNHKGRDARKDVLTEIWDDSVRIAAVPGLVLGLGWLVAQWL